MPKYGKWVAGVYPSETPKKYQILGGVRKLSDL